MSRDLPDGVYFDLPHETYLALPRLGSSSLNDLYVSPATFWWRSWMNPDKPEDAERTRDARRIGRAYHVARLEPERFHETYARGFAPSEHPDALATDSAVCAALADMGETQRMKGENAPERALRLMASGYDGGILSVLREAHDEDHDGMDMLPPDIFDQIVASAALLRRTPEIADLLEGGFPEVSILWTLDGVPMRARIDYLRPAGWVDLKTFSNSANKAVDQCIADAFRFNRYFVQAAAYDMAVEAVRAGAVRVRQSDDKTQLDLVNRIAGASGPLPCHYLFIESNGCPNIVARHVRLRSLPPGGAAQEAGAEAIAGFMFNRSRLGRRGFGEVDYALRQFRWGMEVYGPDEPWGPRRPLGDLDDADYHDNWLDGESR